MNSSHTHCKLLACVIKFHIILIWVIQLCPMYERYNNVDNNYLSFTLTEEVLYYFYSKGLNSLGLVQVLEGMLVLFHFEVRLAIMAPYKPSSKTQIYLFLS